MKDKSIEPKKEISHLRETLFWKEQFYDFSGETNLPSDFIRPLSWGVGYAQITERVPEKTINKLQDFAQHQSFLIFTLLASAWSILLARYTGKYDVVYGTPRPLNNGQGLVCVRIHLRPIATFKEVLIEMRSTLEEIFVEKTFDYEAILAAIGVEKKRNRSSLFSTIFSMEGFQPEFKNDQYRSDLLVRFDPVGASITIKYNQDLFCKNSIEHLEKQYITMLEALCEQLNTSIHLVDDLMEEEKKLVQSLLTVSLQTSSFPCIHQVFETIADQYPDALSIEEEEIKLSYRELNERANQIAHYLLGVEHVKNGDFVAFIGRRGIDYISAILGILKAGCAFIPIDASYPDKRISYMLENSQAKVVLHAEKELFSLIGSNFSKENPSILITPQSQAYMIYTSGSTGEPKGVIIRHDGKMNHLLDSARSFSLSRESRCLFSASISTDISIWQALVALMQGGTTVIIRDEILFDAEKLWKFIEERHIHIMQFVPSFIESVLAITQKIVLNDLQILILAGEKPSPFLINTCLKLFPHTLLFNAYGPSEASDIVSMEHFEEYIKENQMYISIGKPLSNLALFILDDSLRHQPFYAKGEIYIAGVGVGVGYWKDEEKTAAAFVLQAGGAIWYKTGDYGRMLPDGKIEFLGRNDAQVKVRGFRFELSEVENCLNSHPTVSKTKAIVQLVGGHNALCAYIILKEKEIEGKKEQLSPYVKQHLPQFMHPSYFCFLEAFPLLPGGKIDLLRLPHLLTTMQNKARTPPQGEKEVALAKIIAKAIGICEKQIDMQASFFDLGGTSIHLIAIKHLILEELKTDVAINTLFHLQSIQDLCNHIHLDSTPSHQFPAETCQP